MAVAHEASNADGANVGLAILPFSLTIPAGLLNSMLVLLLNGNPAPASGVQLDSNSAAFTKLNSDLADGTGRFAQVYYLLSPPSGVQTADVPGVGSKGGCLAVFSGVDQVTPFGTEVNAGNVLNPSNPETLSVTVLAGGMAIDFAAWIDGDPTPTPDASQTLFTGCPTGTGGTTDQLMSGSFKSASGTVAMSFTGGGTGQFLYRVIPINPAGAAPSNNTGLLKRRTAAFGLLGVM